MEVEVQAVRLLTWKVAQSKCEDLPMMLSNAGGSDERRGLADWESCRDCQACHQ